MKLLMERKIIKSKITGDAFFFGTGMFLTMFGLLAFIYKAIVQFSLRISDILILLLFLFVFYMGIVFLKHIKHITIEDTVLKYYSALRPFGKTLNLDNYKGKIILQETGAQGSYDVLYLIDQKNTTSFKIMGLHYKNFEEINNAIELKKLRFNPSFSLYYKLLFFEKINITEKDSIIESRNAVLSLIYMQLKQTNHEVRYFITD
jgi:hypothetical protein